MPVTQSLQGSLQERSAVDLVGDPVGRDERHALLPLETMARDGTEDLVLVLRRQSAERMRQRRTDPPQSHLPLRFG
jgi:hypothetical protein